MKTSCLLIILALLALIILSCSSKPKSATLEGRVILTNDTGEQEHDPVDFSGVTVALYKLATLDTTLVRINTEHPQIGVLINQKTDFDHRNTIPLKSSVTEADGSFEIDGIDSGEYNIVLMKEQWSIKYLYHIDVKDGEEINIGEIELFPAMTLSGSELDHITFRSDHTYIIDGIVSFIGPVTFEPRTSIYGTPGTSIRFYGNVSTPPTQIIFSPWKLLSAKDMYLAGQCSITTNDYMTSVVLYEDSPQLSNGVIHHLNSGVALNGAYCKISNVIMRYCGTGFTITDGNVSIDHAVVADFTNNESNKGIDIQSSSSGQTQINTSIFCKLHYGIGLNMLSTVLISNCYFYDNFRAIFSNCPGSIDHCAFEQNEFDIYRSYSANITDISYNNFYYTKRTGIRPIGGVLINNNNFFEVNENFINIYNPDLPGNCSVTEDLDATYNYWAVSHVDDYLLDATDNQNFPDAPCAHYIIYNPRRYSQVTDAGIQ